ncbi:hypothetical protein [Hydrogenobacter thermophilus]|uniref:hypothetical protein n=1 Tax=Hydrogenobacter thermophilus TaxID=940 RepID=UPI0030F56CE6
MLLISFIFGVLYVEALYLLSGNVRILYLSSFLRVALVGTYFLYLLKSFGLETFILSILAFHVGMMLHLIIRGWVFNGLVKNL